MSVVLYGYPGLSYDLEASTTLAPGRSGRICTSSRGIRKPEASTIAGKQAVVALSTVTDGPLAASGSSAARAGGEIVDAEKRLMTEFAKRGKTVVMVDRKPFIAAVQSFYASGKQPTGEALPWPKDVYDKLQAIK